MENKWKVKIKKELEKKDEQKGEIVEDDGNEMDKRKNKNTNLRCTRILRTETEFKNENKYRGVKNNSEQL